MKTLVKYCALLAIATTLPTIATAAPPALSIQASLHEKIEKKMTDQLAIEFPLVAAKRLPARQSNYVDLALAKSQWQLQNDAQLTAVKNWCPAQQQSC